VHARPLALCLLALTLALAAARPAAAADPTDPTDPTGTVGTFLDAVNRADAPAALAQLAPEAEAVGLASCTPTPCIGRVAVIEALLSGGTDRARLAPVGPLRAVGSDTVVGRLELQAISRGVVVDGVVYQVSAVVPNGRIVRLWWAYDLRGAE
jgi:hypothetical protein